ncbi:MAG TPA: hypothetical protein VH333_17960 [Pseudonocardiaceae bacterium]|jgi:hypothetical protein|nr:hypothetical protein [Pseudonocardiaceae bacterium]
MTDPTIARAIVPTTLTPATTPAPTAPTTIAPVKGNELSDLPGGWQVSPDKVSAFAGAVQQVRADLDAVFKQVDLLTSPSYQAQLGSSPVGQALTAKFVDRLSGDQGLLTSLSSVLTHLDQFVSNAEQSATQYQGSDTSTADTLNTLNKS